MRRVANAYSVTNWSSLLRKLCQPGAGTLTQRSRSANVPTGITRAKEADQFRYHRGMMGGGMMGHGMMGQGYGRGSPMAMRIIFSLMDANGDGKLSLEEFQAAHERIFKAMDADHDS